MAWVVEVSDADLTGMSELLRKQVGHMDKVAAHVDTYGSNVDGMECKALRWLRPTITSLADRHRNAASATGTSFGMTGLLVHSFRSDMRDDDRDLARELRQVLVDEDPVVPELTDGFPRPPKGYADDPPSFPDPGEADVDIVKQLKEVDRELAEYEDFWQEMTGDSLLVTLTEPILGDYGRLNYLAVAYNDSAKALYDIAANLRIGTMTIGPAWNGEAGHAFESFMFRLHMGVGGLGDLHLLTAQAYQWMFHEMCQGLTRVIELLGRLARKVLKWLRDNALRPEVKDAIRKILRGALRKAVPGVGWVSGVVDIGKVIFYCYYAAQLVEQLMREFESLMKKLQEVRKYIEQVHGFYQSGQTLLKDPDQWFQDLYHGTVRFEHALSITRGKETKVELGEGLWNPLVGAWRVGLLPRW